MAAGTTARAGVLRGGLGFATCAALILFFTVLQFPWQRLRPWIVTQLSHATGAEVELDGLELGLSLRGPVADLAGVRVRHPGSPMIALDTARVGPAFSTSWLSGDPALAIDLWVAGGAIVGTVWTGDALGFAGRFEGIDPAALPLPLGTGPTPIDGVISGRADVVQVGGRWAGAVHLESRSGSLALPGLPLALPFDVLGVDLDLGEDGSVRVSDGRLDGPMASFDVSGSIGPGPQLAQSPLALDVQLRGVQPALREPLRGQGIVLDGTGSARIRLEGTPSRPILR